MARTTQPTLVDTPAGYRHRYCRKCGRPLTNLDSRLTGYGPECDPTRRPGHAPEHHVDQEPLPGT
ncbi:DUF6011 domain-containing protein [Streptomyces sp. sk2.1]|uniref:DUF6011 domain-containing protein n=1 Tax=Streptomyces sp. sk2.1 TaxID=2478959 RepID=UPI0011E890BC|nr:DUF6011 domain-containing protein [Streptomyces sp. sk2.1]TXS68915.1 hypothetical protein EAO76_26480 [Streptomyces sp. sk2.1]